MKLQDHLRKLTTKHDHSLGGMVGYRVVETQGSLGLDEPNPDRGRTVAWFAAKHYAAAHALRSMILGDPDRGVATVDTEYVCGCLSVARAAGETSIWETS